ncbi:MAG: ComEC/Rec2 family competence protein [Pirellulaceae bacterium]|nr:ComEC/Rec2 family competence protein [Pirellulaceae bacterium]
MQQATGTTWHNRFNERMRRLIQRPMLSVFAFSMLGIAMAASFPNAFPWSLVAIGAIATWLLFAIISRNRLVIPAILLTLPAIAAWRYQAQEQLCLHDRLHYMATDSWSPVVVEGVIESSPHWRPDLLQIGGSPKDADLSSDKVWQTLVEVRVTALRDHREWQRAEFGRMQLTIQGRVRRLFPGDHVECMVDWQLIGPPSNPGQFDFAAKYRRSGIFVRARTDVPTQVKKIGKPDRGRLDRLLSRVMVAGDIAFHRYVSHRQATLASALVLGQREQVEWSMQESLLATGTIHMLAISGMHIEMVAISVVAVCLILRVPRHTMLMATMVIVVAYALLCGGNPPVARAAVLVVVLGIAKWIGKTSNSMNLLGFAAVAVLLYRPSNWMEIGTQLSFLAVAILIVLKGEPEEDAERRDRLEALLTETYHPLWKFGIVVVAYSYDLLRTSFWVWLLTAPLVLYRFHVLSPIAALLNLILWIPMLLALLSGLSLLVFGPLTPILGYPLGWLCGVSLWLTDRIVQFSVDVPMSHFWLPAPPTWWVIGFYSTIFVVLGMFGFGKRARRSLLLFACVWIAVGVIPSIDRQYGPWLPGNRIQPQDRVTITFIDVGHGTSVLIQTPSDEAWLYDAGRLGNAQRSYLGIAGVLWERRLSRLDGVILSHADSDHFNAISGLSKRFAIDRLITTKQTMESNSASLQNVLTNLRKMRIPIEMRKKGDMLSEGSNEVAFEFLHPPIEGVPGNDNANSLCMMIEYAGHRVLLPGDLEGQGTNLLIGQPKRSASVLMAPHHGSLSESPLPLLEWCQPKCVIISGGTKAKSPKVREAYQALGSTVKITAVEHAVRCTIHRSGALVVEQWEQSKWVTSAENNLK